MDKISINELLNPDPYICLATPKDNSDIIEFLQTVTMKIEGMDLYYDRSPDFFSFLKEQGEKSFTFLFRNVDGSLHGLAVVTIRKAYVNGEICKVGYLSDLRMDTLLNKKTRVSWRKVYSEILLNCEQIDEFDQCQYFYSAILGGNKDAIKSLTSNKKNIYYDKMSEYKAVTVLGRIFKIFLNNNYVLKTGDQIEQSHLISFLDGQEQSKQFGYVFGQEDNYEWNRRVKYWKGFNQKDFLVVCSQTGEILSVTLPWADEDSRKLVVKKASFMNKLLGASKIILGTKPIFEGQSLKFLYLTHLSFKRELKNIEKYEIIKFYLRYLFRKKVLKNYHGISFFDTTGFSDNISSLKYVKQVSIGHFFQVRHKDNPSTLTTNRYSFEIATS